MLDKWWPRGESNSHALAGTGFSYHSGFHQLADTFKAQRVCGLDYALTVKPYGSLGPARLVSTPSEEISLRLGSVLAISLRNKPSPNLGGSTPRVSPGALKLC
ncbi:MAG: hypothetical protein K1X29_10090 [Bdellovibrionales bacterium]|nr:hypothetical protein [Bdellovibrionales bacterium]